MLNDRYAYLTRVLNDGRVLDVVPLTFGRARLTVSHDSTAETFYEAW